MEYAGIKSVAKALQLMDYVLDQSIYDRAVPLGELAEALQSPTNSARNLLKTLVDCGYLDQAGHGLYCLGAKVRQIGRLNQLQTQAFRQGVVEVLRGFVSQTDEACVLTGLIRGERFVAATVESTQVVRIEHSIIKAKPFFALPTGRVLAAMADDRQLRDILRRQGLPGAHWDQIETEDDLAEALQTLRDCGDCRMIEDEAGLFSLAMPVAGTGIELPIAVGTFAPIFRCSPKRQRALADALHEVAGQLAVVLDGDGAGHTQSERTKGIPCH